MGFLLAIKSKLLLWGGAALGVLALLGGVYLSGKKKGKRQVREAVSAKTTESLLSTIKKDKEVVDEVRATSSSDRRKRMRLDARDRNSE